MNVKKEILPKSRIKLTIEFPAEKTKKFFDEAYEKLAPSVQIKGFRPGQAPRLMTLESIGHGRFHQTALDIALPQVYYEAVQSEKIIPVQQPAVSIKEFAEDKPFVFEAEVDVIPEIKLADYKSIKINPPAGGKKEKFEAKKEEVEELIKKLRFQSAVFNIVDHEAQKGDRIEVNFDGSIDNVHQDNLSSKNHPIILGEGSMIKGFEKELEGMKKDEEKEFDLDVPNVADAKKTKKAHFKVKMVDIKETVLPELDKEFAKRFGHGTMEQLISAIEKSIVDEKELRHKQEMEKEILKQIVAKSKIEIPESLIQQEIGQRLTGLQQQMGHGFAKYLENMGKKIEDLQKDMREPAETSVKNGLILGEIAKAEGLLKHTHDQKEQQEIIRKTMDKLIEMATK